MVRCDGQGRSRARSSTITATNRTLSMPEDASVGQATQPTDRRDADSLDSKKREVWHFRGNAVARCVALIRLTHPDARHKPMLQHRPYLDYSMRGAEALDCEKVVILSSTGDP